MLTNIIFPSSFSWSLRGLGYNSKAHFNGQHLKCCFPKLESSKAWISLIKVNRVALVAWTIMVYDILSLALIYILKIVSIWMINVMVILLIRHISLGIWLWLIGKFWRQDKVLAVLDYKTLHDGVAWAAAGNRKVVEHGNDREGPSSHQERGEIKTGEWIYLTHIGEWMQI